MTIDTAPRDLATPAGLLPAPGDARTPPPLMRGLAGPALAGLVTVAVFFGGFGGWAATAPLAGAAIAIGTVTPSGQSKVIQHFEGGIVQEIIATEGAEVRPGDVLARVLDVKARTSFDQAIIALHQRQAESARLTAELKFLQAADLTDLAAEAARRPDANADIAFPPELLEAAGHIPDVAEFVDDERGQYTARLGNYLIKLRILLQSMETSRTSTAALNTQIETIEQQAVLIDQEIRDIGSLVEQALTSNSRLLGLKRERAGMDGEIAALRVRIAGEEQAIVSSQIEIESLRSGLVQDATGQLATVRTEIADVRQRLAEARDTLERTVVRSPVAGIVNNMKVHTVGGVIAPGGELMTIVPTEEQMVIQAQISPGDIDVVRQGQIAHVTLLAYSSRDITPLEGEVTSISADALEDANGQPYFLGTVSVESDLIEAVGPDIRLVPGMQVEVKITTERRTMLDYLLDPILRFMNRSFLDG